MNLGHVSKSQSGFTISAGRLINQGGDSRTGIQRMADERETMKREKKIQAMSEAYYRGERMARLEEKLENDMQGRAYRAR